MDSPLHMNQSHTNFVYFSNFYDIATISSRVKLGEKFKSGLIFAIGHLHEAENSTVFHYLKIICFFRRMIQPSFVIPAFFVSSELGFQ